MFSRGRAPAYAMNAWSFVPSSLRKSKDNVPQAIHLCVHSNETVGARVPPRAYLVYAPWRLMLLEPKSPATLVTSSKGALDIGISSTPSLRVTTRTLY